MAVPGTVYLSIVVQYEINTLSTELRGVRTAAQSGHSATSRRLVIAVVQTRCGISKAGRNAWLSLLCARANLISVARLAVHDA